MKTADQTAGAAAPEGDLQSARTLIVHIGDHKTGSTAIQYALARQRIRIAGVPPLYTASLSHNGLPVVFRALLAEPKSPAAERGRRVIAEMSERIVREAPAVCVISAEEFEGFDPKGLRRLLDGHFAPLFDRIRVIGYVRPHLGRIVSEYAERTKIGTYTGDLEAFVLRTGARRDFVYTRRFLKWRSVFGADFVLRPFVRSALAEGDVVADFLRASLGPVPVSIAALGSQNESLSLEDLLRLKYLHAQTAERPKRFHHDYGWALARLAGKLPRAETATRVQMHRSLADLVGKYYLADARKLDREFFGDSPCMEAALRDEIGRACAAPQPSRAEDLFSASEMRSLALCAEMIGEMLDNGKAPWFEHFHARRLDALHETLTQAPGTDGTT